MGKIISRTVEEYERLADEYCRNLPPEHFMEATPQGTQRAITLASMAALRFHRPDVQVFNELLVQYLVNGAVGQVVPDNMLVVSDERSTAVGSFNIEYEPAPPFMVMEYVSANSKRKDYRDSFRKYEQELRVRYCLMFDPETQDLRIHCHNGQKYVRLTPNARGRWEIPELELETGLLDGWVRFWFKGRLIELPADLQRQFEDAQQRITTAEQRADVERQRAEEAEQEIQQERRRAERAEQEGRQVKQRAEQEKQRAERLAAQLRALGLEPTS